MRVPLRLLCAFVAISFAFMILGYYAHRRVSRVARILEFCDGEFYGPRWGEITRPSQVAGVNILRFAFGAPTGIVATPRDRADVQSIAFWRSASTVSINATHLSDLDLDALSMMRDLRVLQVEQGTAVEGSFLGSLPSPPRIEVLNLPGSRFADENARYVAWMAGMRHLNLGHTPLSDRGMEPLSSLGALRHLDVTRTGITCRSLPVISRMRHLEYLSIAYTAVEGGCLCDLRALTALHMLRIEGIHASAEEIRFLTDLPKVSRVFCSVLLEDLGTALDVFASMPQLSQLLLVIKGAAPADTEAMYSAALGCQVTWCYE